MRDELTLMELVDRYLGGELNAAERAAFGERIRTNAGLRELVEDQRALHGGMKRLALRPAVNKAYRSYKWGKWVPGIGGAAVIAILAVGGLMVTNDHHPTKEPLSSTEQNAAAFTQLKAMDSIPAIDTVGSGHPSFANLNQSKTRKPLLTRTDTRARNVSATTGVSSLADSSGIGLTPIAFSIDTKADTTIITPNGLVVDIPRGSFTDGSGTTITTRVLVTLIEAINGVDIMKAGLSNMAGDMLLETGGMFYIDAQVDGQQVGIDPKKPLTVMVPSENANAGMMLYEGVMNEVGVVDWSNPQPLPRTLVPLDINTLDFYPPGYLDKLAELGKDAGDKAYADSLYWSFNWQVARTTVSDAETMLGTATPNPIVTMRVRGMKDRKQKQLMPDTIPKTERTRGIAPSNVQSIWNERFNNTNLATREFEERMREIHRTCDNQVLDLYANNLDKNLSQLDSMAVRMGHGAFATFALRNDGRVQLPEHAAERLRKVYTEWSQQYAEAARKTQEEFYRKEAEADQEARKRQMERQMKDLQQDRERFTREFTANLRSAYDQLGYPWTPAPPPREAYVVPVRASGWWNVDKAVLAATTSRTSMSYTDKKSGKTATLTYTPITVEVASKESFSELRVYLIPKELNSYQRVTEKDGAFTENLNSLFEYDVICMGRQHGQQYAAFQWNVGGERTITLTMEPTDDEALKRMIRASTSVVSGDLLEQARHLEWLEREAKRQQAKQAHYELRSALMPVVFPCWGEGVPAK
jgi:hypothetical protein